MPLVLAYTIIHSNAMMAGLCSRSDSSDYEELVERKVKKDRNEIILIQLCNKIHQSKKKQVDLEKLIQALEVKLQTIREMLFILPTKHEQMSKVLLDVKFSQVELRDLLYRGLIEPAKKEDKISDPPCPEIRGLCELVEGGRKELKSGWQWQFVHWRPFCLYGVTVKDIIVHRGSKYFYQSEQAALSDAHAKCSDFIKFDYVYFDVYEVV